MTSAEQHRRFEQLALPHLDAAYNLARWLTRNEHDAQDVVQEAYVRALRYMDSFRGDSARGWLLQIVRNTCFSWMRDNRPAEVVALDDPDDVLSALPGPAADEPQSIVMRNADRVQINQAIAALPIAFREVLVLRELEDCSYADIARIADIPIGTVMSRLARARNLMRQALTPASRPVSRTVLQSVQSPRTDGAKR
jgi:RNA polymerase sigma-70 factor (ECF subfamily)